MTFPFWYSSLFFLELRIISLFHLLWVCFWTCSLTFHTLQQVCLYINLYFLTWSSCQINYFLLLPPPPPPPYYPAPGKLRKIFLPAFIPTESSQVSMCSTVALLGLLLWVSYLLFWFGLPVSGAHVIVFLDLESKSSPVYCGRICGWFCNLRLYISESFFFLFSQLGSLWNSWIIWK